MGSVTIQVIGDVSVGTKAKTYVVSDADVNRLVAAEKAAYTSSFGTANPTVAQALTFFADTVMQTTKDSVKVFEQGVAAAAISPITAT